MNKKIENYCKATILCGVLATFSSCATIVSGGAPKITIDGDVKDQ